MWTGSLRLDASVAPEWESPGQQPRCPRKSTEEAPVKRFSWKEPPSNVPNDKCEVQVRKGRRHELPPLSPVFLALSATPNRALLLCGLAVNLGFEGLLAANTNLDLLGLGFGFLCEVDLQHALIVVGAYLPRVHRVRQRERAGEASVLPLDATEVLLFLFLLELALAVDGKGVVLDADVNVFLVDARDFNFQGDVVLVLVDIDRRCETGGRQRLLRAFGAIELTDKTVQAILHCGRLTERIPTGQYCHNFLLRKS